MSIGAVSDLSANDSLQSMKVQRIDEPTPMNVDPTPDRLAAMRKRLLLIKQSMESIDLPSVEPSQPKVSPVVRQKTFTIKGSAEMPCVESVKPKVPVARQNTFTMKDPVDLPIEEQGQPDVSTIVAQSQPDVPKVVAQNTSSVFELGVAALTEHYRKEAEAKEHARTSTCSRVRAYVKRLDYYKPRAASAPRVVDTNRVQTKTNYKISKEAIKKSLLNSLETSTVDNHCNEQKEKVISKRTALKASRIPVRIIPPHGMRKTTGLEARMAQLQLPEIPKPSKIPVSPKFKARLSSQMTQQ